MSKQVPQFFRSRQPVVVHIVRGQCPRIVSTHSTINAANREVDRRKKYHSADESWVSGMTSDSETSSSAARRIVQNEIANLLSDFQELTAFK
jgi:hypothetical protein